MLINSQTHPICQTQDQKIDSKYLPAFVKLGAARPPPNQATMAVPTITPTSTIGHTKPVAPGLLHRCGTTQHQLPEQHQTTACSNLKPWANKPRTLYSFV